MHSYLAPDASSFLRISSSMLALNAKALMFIYSFELFLRSLLLDYMIICFKFWLLQFASLLSKLASFSFLEVIFYEFLFYSISCFSSDFLSLFF